MEKEKLKLKNQNVLDSEFSREKVVIVNINIEKMKRKTLFESYYNNIISNDIPESIKTLLNCLLEYHYQDVYGDQYKEIYENIERKEYQCLMYVSENN